MNWLPRPSLYDEAVAARQKRRDNARQAMANQQSIASAFGNLHNMTTQGQVDIAIKIAHARLLANPTRTDKRA